MEQVEVTQADKDAAEAVIYGQKHVDLGDFYQAFARHRIEATRTNDQAKDEEIARYREALEDIPGVAKAAAYGCGLDNRLAGIIADTVEKITSHVLAEKSVG